MPQRDSGCHTPKGIVMKLRLLLATGMLVVLGGCATYDYAGGSAGGYYRGSPETRYRYPDGYYGGYGSPYYYGAGSIGLYDYPVYPTYRGPYYYGRPGHRPPPPRPDNGHRPPPRPGGDPGHRPPPSAGGPGNQGPRPPSPRPPSTPRPPRPAEARTPAPWRNLNQLKNPKQRER